MKRCLLLTCLLWGSAPHAAAQQIGFATTPQDYWTCYLTETNPATVHIVARTMQGFQGAEFAVEGFPIDPASGYLVTAEPSPDASIVLGDPLRGGANIAFDECQSDQVVVLFTITVTHVFGEPQDFVGRVVRHSTPSNPWYSCPLLNHCDAPSYTAECVLGGVTSQEPRSPVPSNPTPPDGALDVSLSPALSAEYIGEFICCEPVDAYPYKAIYFGTDPDPPLVEEAYPGSPPTAASPFQPGILQPDTQYYWRVDHAPWNACVVASGPVWTFHTTASVSVEELEWGTIKRRYR